MSATFWPGMLLQGLQMVSCAPGTAVVGPDGRVFRVSSGKAVRRGMMLYLVNSDYEALKSKVPAIGGGGPT